MRTNCGVTVLVVITVIALTFVFVNSISNVSERFDFITDPQLKRGDQFYLKTIGGDYVSVCQSCQPTDQNLYNKCSSVLCLKRYPTRGSVWVYLPHDDGTFSVRSDAIGSHWKRCDNCVDLCPNVICSDGINARLPSARFELIKLGSNLVSIKTDIGTFLDVNECSQQCGKVVAGIGHGTFVIEPIPSPTPIIKRVVPPRPPNTKTGGYAPITIAFRPT